MEENYTTQQVIEALFDAGVPQQVIELVVPIAAYESRVDGVPFVHEAADALSPSYGVFQINVDSEPAFYYQVMRDAGFNIDRLFTKDQIMQLTNNVVGEDDKDVRAFSDNAQEKAKTFIAKSPLIQQARLFKKVYDNKSKELNTDEPMTILKSMYTLTVDKYEDKTNEDAQAVKTKIEEEVNKAIGQKTKLKADMDLFKEVDEQIMQEYESKYADLSMSLIEKQVNKQRKEAGYDPVRKNLLFRYTKGQRPPPPEKFKPIADANAPKPKMIKPIVGGPQGLSEEQIKEMKEKIDR